MSKRLLVVDDEETLCEGLRFNLETEGYQVDTAYSAEEVLAMDVTAYDLLLLDIMMGDISGTQLAKILKANPATVNIPIIFCTVKDTEDDMVEGLELGADDYITKPYSLRNVLARVRTVLRRTSGTIDESKAEEKVTYEGLTVIPARKLCLVDGMEVKLPKKEFEILLKLLRHPGRVFTREELLREIWPDDVMVLDRVLGYVATRRVGQHIRRLKNFAEKAEKGEKIYDTEPFPHDELGEISNHIVRLYASLQQVISERDHEHTVALYEQREKERIKKQLTNNINHELKTPVASIRICLETLMSHPEMSKEKREEFLSRCFVNSRRLQQLLADVSLITRMEDGAQTIAREKIDLSEIISTVVEERIDTADTNGFTLRNDICKPIGIEGNRGLLESVFYNLIDNAIAYSGGNLIIIRTLPDTGSKVTILVSDNGKGVAEEHLPRLFERFYRIDKGRSRAAGGTGLGLSIVKNVIQLHGGSISVTNDSHGGLCFKITLPICG